MKQKVLLGILVSLAVILLKIYVWQTFVIVSPSMAPAYPTGQRVVVNKLPWSLPRFRSWGNSSLHRGQVVVVQLPAVPVPIIKRIIGLPGDYIEQRGLEWYVNGTLVKEQIVWHGDNNVSSKGPGPDDTYQVLYHPFAPLSRQGSWPVPPGHIFLLGDNRDQAEDSRQWGPVSLSTIQGAPWFVF